MPHFGKMDESGMQEHEAALLRARLHLRCGRRRLREGKLRAGVETVYDAVCSAMQSFVLAPAVHDRFEHVDINDNEAIYKALAGAGVLDGRFEFARLEEMAERAVEGEVPVYDMDYDPAWLLGGVESVMTQLGALPFDESSLPPEDPGAF